MNEGYIDWKGRALAAEAETLNLKNLCAHHGICTACGEYYSHHYIEPFATCNCNTSEWYELTEYMKLQDELRKLREKKPVAWCDPGGFGSTWGVVAHCLAKTCISDVAITLRITGAELFPRPS